MRLDASRGRRSRGDEFLFARPARHPRGRGGRFVCVSVACLPTGWRGTGVRGGRLVDVCGVARSASAERAWMSRCQGPWMATQGAARAL